MGNTSKYSLLDTISSPEDLRKLDMDQLIELCSELRQDLIDELSCNPGHFAASLGVVELTVALHYIYNTPYDKLVWDVGHQAYVHKILTGRKPMIFVLNLSKSSCLISFFFFFRNSVAADSISFFSFSSFGKPIIEYLIHSF